MTASSYTLYPFQGRVRFSDVGIKQVQILRVLQYRDVIDGEVHFRNRDELVRQYINSVNIIIVPKIITIM